jgi:hypothetical protein
VDVALRIEKSSTLQLSPLTGSSPLIHTVDPPFEAGSSQLTATEMTRHLLSKAVGRVASAAGRGNADSRLNRFGVSSCKTYV